MGHTTISDLPDEDVEAVRGFKHELANRASYHGVSSVRTVVNKTYGEPVPAIRVESQFDHANKSVSQAMIAHGLDILTAFVTKDGRLVMIVGEKPTTEVELENGRVTVN